jgi:hypothetical protein
MVPYHVVYEEGNEYVLGPYADQDGIHGIVSHDKTKEDIQLSLTIEERLGLKC